MLLNQKKRKNPEHFRVNYKVTKLLKAYRNAKGTFKEVPLKKEFRAALKERFAVPSQLPQSLPKKSGLCPLRRRLGISSKWFKIIRKQLKKYYLHNSLEKI